MTDTGVPRNTYYGFIDRDFQKTNRTSGTVIAEYRVNDALTFTNKFSDEQSLLNYIGTLPEQGTSKTGCNTQGGNFTNPNPATGSSVSIRRAATRSQRRGGRGAATIKFDTGPVRKPRHRRESFRANRSASTAYTGLTSEASVAGAFANGS